MNAEIRKSFKPKLAGQIPTVLSALLKFIGVSKQHIPFNRGFWSSEYWVIDELLEVARTTYKAKIKEVYPRLHGDNCEQAALLNAAMDRIEKLFERRGKPSAVNGRPLIDTARVCQYPPCGKSYASLTRWKFCSDKCMWRQHRALQIARQK